MGIVIFLSIYPIRVSQGAVTSALVFTRTGRFALRAPRANTAHQRANCVFEGGVWRRRRPAAMVKLQIATPFNIFPRRFALMSRFIGFPAESTTVAIRVPPGLATGFIHSDIVAESFLSVLGTPIRIAPFAVPTVALSWQRGALF